MAAIEDATGTATKSFSNQTFEAGQTVILDLADGLLRPVTLNPTATAQHTFDSNGDLSGTSVTLTLNASEQNRLSEIKSLEVEIKKGDEVYRTFRKTSNFSTVEIISGTSEGVEGKLYLPAGEYSVSGSYQVEGDASVKEFTLNNITVGQPELEITLSCDTETALVIKDIRARINVSTAVVNENGFTYLYLGIKEPNATKSIKSWAGEAIEANNPQMFIVQSYDISSAGSYTLSSTFCFDDNYHTTSMNISIKNKYYKIVGSPISKAEDLTHGKTYLIKLYNEEKYWYDGTTSGIKKYQINNTSDISVNSYHILEFHKETNWNNCTKDDYSSYGSTTGGTWKSVQTGKYLSDNLKFEATSVNDSNVLKLVFCSNYSSNWNEHDVDIYNTGTSNTLYYIDGDPVQFKLGQLSETSNSFRKWYIYEVQLVE